MSRIRILPTDHERLDIINSRGAYTSLGYRSAAVATREGRAYGSGSADLFLEYDRARLIAQSRAFYRDNAIYRGIIDRAVSYIIGCGFGLRVLTEDGQVGQRIEAAWRRMHRESDVRDLVTGADADARVCREAMLCGDTGAIKRDGGRLQYIEAEQITDGRSGSTGIAMDDDGRPVTYAVCPYSDKGRLTKSRSKAIPAEDFLFVVTPGRPSQTRGEPVLQSSFAMLHRINDICDSEAIAWQMLSRLAIAVTREMGEQKGWNESTLDPNKVTNDRSGDIAARLMELDYAIIYHGQPGDQIKGIERNIPGDSFSDSLRTFLRLLGLPIGMPLELILLDWSQANYSQSRAVLEQAYQTFLAWQERLRQRYYQPLFDWRRPALLKAAGVAAGTELDTEWILPTFPWIDQLKEAQAHGIKMDRTMTTHAHVLKELNLDREDVVNACQAEVVDAIERAKVIKAEHGVDVPWQMFCGRQSPKAESPAGLRNQAEDDAKKETDDA